MRRTVGARLRLEAAGPARLILAIAVHSAYDRDESLSVRQDDAVVEPRELVDAAGARLHVLDVVAGEVFVEYAATVRGGVAPAVPAPLDEVEYLRPSRYCESDVLGPTGVAMFGGLEGHALVSAVETWVAASLAYEIGSSSPTDGSVATMLARTGVCRDFAHLTVALLRAVDVPARLAAVYAPGLEPMDFHAVAEALVDGEWWVVDPTRLAPRSSLVRIAAGRDAADTAFLTSIGDPVEVLEMTVTATAEPFAPEDPAVRLHLG